jgi:hypothetical protein
MSDKIKPFAAVFVAREDGDYDLVCVFATDNIWFEEMTSQSSGAVNAAEQFAHDLETWPEGEEEAKVVYFDRLSDIPNVLDGQEKCMVSKVALSKLLDYGWDDEETSYEECGGGEHIFDTMKLLRSQSEA